MSFGDRLQALRRSNHLTQEEFAQQLKVSRQAVSKWESSKGYPELEKVIYICNRYGVSMDELFADEVPPRKGQTAEEKKGEERPLSGQPLKKAIGNFLTNLSPHNQQLLGTFCSLFMIVLLILLATVVKGDVNQMLMKIIWAALLVLFTVGEAVTVGLTAVWFAAGALAGLIAALLGGPLWLQIGLFILVSALSLAAIRPIAKKYFNSRVEPTNADRSIGQVAPVIEEIDNLQAKGAVRLGGLSWSARSESGEVIPEGTLVRVLRIEGVKVFVEEVKENVPAR